MRPALNPLVLSLKESATLAINLKALELRRQLERAEAPAAQEAAMDAAEIPADNPDEVPPTVPPVLTNASDVARMLETVYPEQLRKDGVGGTVGLWIFVDETGRVGDAEVRESSGYTELDEAALRLVGSMEFSPAQDSYGNARSVWISQPIQFTTEE